MYRIRLGCAAYAQMTITPLLGGAGVGYQARRMMYRGGNYVLFDQYCLLYCAYYRF